MHTFRQFLLVMLAVCAMPTVAHAQWASAVKEHDWRIGIGGNSYGLVQEMIHTTSLVTGTRVTTVYLGPYKWTTTRFRAAHVAAVMLLAAGVMAVLLLKLMSPRQGANL